VMVTYSSLASAREARETLHGQIYANQALTVEYYAPRERQSTSLLQGDTKRPLMSSLNPHASPFVLDSMATFSMSAPPTCSVVEGGSGYFDSIKQTSSGFAVSHLASNASYPAPYAHSSLPGSLLPSRSTSAASWYVRHNILDSSIDHITPGTALILYHI